MTEGEVRAKRDIPGAAQVFGSVFTVVTATVTAATFAGVTVAVLAAVASIAACIAILVGLNDHIPWNRRKKTVTAVCGGIALILVVVGFAITSRAWPSHLATVPATRPAGTS